MASKGSEQLKHFVTTLIANGDIPESSGARLLAAYEMTGHPFDTVVIELGLMREDTLAKALGSALRLALTPLNSTDLNGEAAAGIGFDFLNSAAMIPLLGENEDVLVLGVADPFDEDGLALVRYFSDKLIEIRVAPRSAIMSGLAALSSAIPENTPSNYVTKSNGAVSEDDLDRLRDFARQAPIVKMVSRIVQLASDEHATDIHIEPFEHEVRVRIRVDGVLKVIETVSAEFLQGIATRIKILSGLDISERRQPQDGRLRLAVRGQEIDLRVSILPAIHGETIVMRLLDRSVVALDLPSLGFAPVACAKLQELAVLPNGIILITGPTGSGKTTTLYALMSLINDPRVKIFTVEDPVEYRLAGITQLQINTASGLTFARALRTVLRQDPDIILVGEIRDRETAEIAMQAALTGHLVLSTLHTNSAAGAVTRLRDMGIEDYLIGATVKGISAQRLVRKLCTCQSKSLVNCPKCEGSGFSGRTVTYEIATLSEQVARLISTGEQEAVIQAALMHEGFETIEENALLLVDSGMTTRGEITRVVRLDPVASS